MHDYVFYFCVTERADCMFGGGGCPGDQTCTVVHSRQALSPEVHFHYI